MKKTSNCMLKEIIQEAINKNPMGVKEALEEELRSRIAYVLSEDETLDESGKGLWANIRARREKGLPRKKPGEKGYPKTLNIESTISESNYGGLSNEQLEQLESEHKRNRNKSKNSVDAEKHQRLIEKIRKEKEKRNRARLGLD